METSRVPTEAELQLGELYQRIHGWLMEWKKDDLVVLAMVLMVRVTDHLNPPPPHSR